MDEAAWLVFTTVSLSGALDRAGTEGGITVALIGGSITYGAGARGNDTYAKRIESWLRETYPDSRINIINAGMSGTDSIVGIHRLTRDVLSHEPDIVIVEFAVNDGVGDNGELYNIEHSYSYESIVREVLMAPQDAAVLPLFCCIEGGYSSQADKEKTGFHYNLPMVSYRDAVMPGINSGELTWSDLTKDGIHPNKDGHRILAEIVINILEKARESEAAYVPGEMPDPLNEVIFSGAEIIESTNGMVSLKGGFAKGSDYWIFKDGWKAESAGDSLVVTGEFRTMHILLNRTADGHGAFFDITVDGGETLRKTTASEFAWDMLSPESVYSSEDAESHEVTITLSSDTPEGCDGANTEILAILISR